MDVKLGDVAVALAQGIRLVALVKRGGHDVDLTTEEIRECERRLLDAFDTVVGMWKKEFESPT